MQQPSMSNISQSDLTPNDSDFQYKGVPLNKIVSLASKSSMSLQNFNLNSKWAINGIIYETAKKKAQKHYSQLSIPTLLQEKVRTNIDQKSASQRIQDWTVEQDERLKNRDIINIKNQGLSLLRELNLRMPENYNSNPYQDMKEDHQSIRSVGAESEFANQIKQLAKQESTANMTMDQVLISFIGSAVDKIVDKDDVLRQAAQQRQVKPRKLGRYVNRTGARSDFEILQLPKVTFIKDHNDRLISKRGQVIGEFKALTSQSLQLEGKSSIVGRPSAELINNHYES